MIEPSVCDRCNWTFQKGWTGQPDYYHCQNCGNYEVASNMVYCNECARIVPKAEVISIPVANEVRRDPDDATMYVCKDCMGVKNGE